MSHVKEIMLGTIAPILGCAISIAMYTSPLKAAYSARRQRSLGEVNPVPFGVTVWSTAIWIAYGFAAANPYMFPANIIGLSAALYTSITCYGLADDKMQVRIMVIICTAAVTLPLLAVCSFFAMDTVAQRSLMWGLIANTVTIVYYGAPLSTALQVIRSRSSASLYTPTCTMNLVNGALWSAYGLAVADYWIYIPNGIGVICATILLVLCAVYPAKSRDCSSTFLLAASSQPPSPTSEAQAQQQATLPSGKATDACLLDVQVDARGSVDSLALTSGTAVYRAARRSIDLEPCMQGSQL